MSRSLNKVGDRWYFVNVVARTDGAEAATVYDIATEKKVHDGDVDHVAALHTSERFELKHLVLPNADPAKATRASSIRRDEWDRWRELTRYIDDHRGSLPVVKSPSVESAATTPLVVKITPLRDLCDILRVLPRESAVDLAKKWTEDTATLAQMFRRSVQDFADYENEAVAFEARKGTAGAASITESEKFARQVASCAARGRLTFAGLTSPLRYVAHEISPRRTPRGKRPIELEGQQDDFTDAERPRRGSNWSGAGGVDLLLTDGTAAVVGEIKAKTDLSLSFAVMQSLMYAAELVTPPQLQRLASHYESLQFLDTRRVRGPQVEIAILFAPGGGKDLDIARALATELMREDVMRAHIRDIRFFEGAMGDDEVTFTQVASSAT